MLKKTVNIGSVILAISAVTLVMYGLKTSCADVSVYVYCAEALR